jgi:methylmalonyl-CoA/ethylmalonyl-CoA epimerase
MIKKLNHVGIAVKDLEKTLMFFESTFGARVLSKTVFQEQKFVSAIVAMGEAQFEILASCETGSMIDKYIEVHSEGIHHVSLQVDGFDGMIRDFKGKGLKVIGEVDMPEFKAAFIHPADNFGVLTEIVELKGSSIGSERPAASEKG